jgi:hypothetical protein
VRFAVAGGRIIGIEAYLVGFRCVVSSPINGDWDLTTRRDDERGIAWDFTPPFTVGLAGRGIGMKTSRNWEKRVVSLDVWDWGRWLHVEMTAPAVLVFFRVCNHLQRADCVSGHICADVRPVIQGVRTGPLSRVLPSAVPDYLLRAAHAVLVEPTLVTRLRERVAVERDGSV